MTACAGAGQSQVEGRGLPKRQVSQAKRARAGVREEVDQGHGGRRCRDGGFYRTSEASTIAEDAHELIAVNVRTICFLVRDLGFEVEVEAVVTMVENGR